MQLFARLLLLLALSACTHRPMPDHHTCGTGWNDCAWQQGLNHA